mgnify:CR=1 FL=1
MHKQALENGRYDAMLLGCGPAYRVGNGDIAVYRQWPTQRLPDQLRALWICRRMWGRIYDRSGALDWLV